MNLRLHRVSDQGEEAMAMHRATTTAKPQRTGVLNLIAASKLLKSAMLLAVAIGALRLVHRDVEQEVTGWVRAVRLDPDNRLIHGLLARLPGLTDHRLEAVSAGTFLYAALYATEGVGLLMHRRWAEYMTVITTALLLPLEVYEVAHRPTAARAAILAANGAIVIYLIARLRSGADRRQNAHRASDEDHAPKTF